MVVPVFLYLFVVKKINNYKDTTESTRHGESYSLRAPMLMLRHRQVRRCNLPLLYSPLRRPHGIFFRCNYRTDESAEQASEFHFF